jgi:hypothetical protein
MTQRHTLTNLATLCFFVFLLIAWILGQRTPAAAQIQEADALRSLGSQALQVTAFTYQGRLTDDSGVPVDGFCDFTFELYDQAGAGSPPSGGTLLGSVLKSGEKVSGGYLAVQLDFGADAFKGDARYLQITLDCGSGAKTLSPRQPLSPVPYALHAASIADGAVKASSIGEPCSEGQVLAKTGDVWSCAQAELSLGPQQGVNHLLEIDETPYPDIFVDLLSLRAYTDVVEYTDGGSQIIRKLAGRTHYEDFDFVCLGPCPDINSWYSAIRNAQPLDALAVSIVILDDQGQEQERWAFTNCWPSRLTTALSDDGQDLLEKYTMTCETMDLIYGERQ